MFDFLVFPQECSMRKRRSVHLFDSQKSVVDSVFLSMYRRLVSLPRRRLAAAPPRARCVRPAPIRARPAALLARRAPVIRVQN
jgi:hypothetical protein